jgi:putative ABC transport system ATP-binding protein
MQTPMISVADLRKTYVMGDVEVNALQGVSFTINRGEFVAIMGPSGSGKSTLMNLIGCLDTPSSGSYVLDGAEVADLTGNDLSLVRARKLGFVFQQYMLLPRQNALRQVEMPLIYRGVSASERRRRAEIALRIVGMRQRMDHKPNELSGGQQQRVAIARALAMEPAVVLFDEPTSALDPRLVREVATLLRALDDLKKTLIVVSHDMDFAHAVSDQVIYFEGGRAVEAGTASEVFNHPKQPETRAFMESFHGGRANAKA